MSDNQDLKAYNGSKPFVFISYAHSDDNRVMPIIRLLTSCNYRCWFDEGIEGGSVWAQNITDHLCHSAGMIAFLSQNYLDSENCLDEIEHAKNKQIPILKIYLENVNEPEWFTLRHGRQQSIFCSQCGTGDRLMDKINQASILHSCRIITVSQSNNDAFYTRRPLNLSTFNHTSQDHNGLKSLETVEKGLQLPSFSELMNIFHSLLIEIIIKKDNEGIFPIINPVC